MELKELIRAYYGCRANKRRSPDTVLFSLHAERDTLRLLDDVNSRSLEPLLYAFVRTKPRPREVIANQMQGKILQWWFDDIMRPFAEKELTARTFNNRKGFGPERAVETLHRDIRESSGNYTRDCWVITRDIRAFFPSTDLARSYDHCRALVERNLPRGEQRDDLLYILLRTVYAYPEKHARLSGNPAMWDTVRAEGKSVIFNTREGKGACLGNQFWQVEKNYDLAEFDRWQVETCGMRYVRYVDDMAWVVQNKEAGLAHVALSERILKERYGYEMHPRKRACQHYSKGGNFISSWYKYDRTYIGNRVVRNARAAIHKYNRNACSSSVASFLSVINSYLGAMKYKQAYGIIRNLVDEVSPRWSRFVRYNDSRRCFVALPNYTEVNRLQRIYNFKLHRSYE